MEKYNKIRELGKSGFGTTWLVQRKSDNKDLVIKEIKLLGLDESKKESTDKEINLLRQISHDYIIGFVDNFKSEDNNTVYIVMEHATNGDLATMIKNRGGRLFTESEVWEYFYQICQAIQYLHTFKPKHIIHRDLKPANIFLTGTNSVKIGEFGLSEVIENSRQNKTTPVGHLYYSAPEFFDDGKASIKSDIWMLGCVLYELATLKYPFYHEDKLKLMEKISKADFNPLPENMSKGLKNLIKSMLQVDPDNRPTIQQIMRVPIIRDFSQRKN